MINDETVKMAVTDKRVCMRRVRWRLVWIRVALVVVRTYVGIALAIAGIVAFVIAAPVLLCGWLCRLGRGRKDVSAPSA